MDFLAKKLRKKWLRTCLAWERLSSLSRSPDQDSSNLGSRANQGEGDQGLPDILQQPGDAAGVKAPLHCREDAEACG